MTPRHATRMGAWHCALAGVALLVGCGGATDTFAGAPSGTESGPCHPDGTCNAGLTCVANACVSQDAATVDTSTGVDTGAVEDTAGTDSATEDSAGFDSSVTVDGTADSGTADSSLTIDADATPIDSSGLPDSFATDSLIADTATPIDTAPTDVRDADVATDADAATDTGADTDGGPLPPYLTTALVTANCDNMASGADVPVALADNAASPIAALPFGFNHFGSAVGFYSVTSNGFVQLWPSSSGAPSSLALNEAIPSSASPNGLVAPFWDDLVVVFSNLRVATFGAAPNRRFVVQWGHWGANGNPNVRLSFQAKLFETTNVIEFHYCAMEAAAALDIARATGSSATIGLENAGGTVGVQHSFNTPASVQTGTLLRFTPQ